MTQVGIFGDQVLPQGPEAQDQVVAEAIAAAEAAEVVETEVEEVPETDSGLPEGFTTTVPSIEQIGADASIHTAETDAEAEENADDDSDDDGSDDDNAETRKAGDIVADIEAAETQEEIDAPASEGAEWKTVQDAADKRTAELAADDDKDDDDE